MPLKKAKYDRLRWLSLKTASLWCCTYSGKYLLPGSTLNGILKDHPYVGKRSRQDYRLDKSGSYSTIVLWRHSSQSLFYQMNLL